MPSFGGLAVVWPHTFREKIVRRNLAVRDLEDSPHLSRAWHPLTVQPLRQAAHRHADRRSEISPALPVGTKVLSEGHARHDALSGRQMSSAFSAPFGRGESARNGQTKEWPK